MKKINRKIYHIRSVSSHPRFKLETYLWPASFSRQLYEFINAVQFIRASGVRELYDCGLSDDRIIGIDEYIRRHTRLGDIDLERILGGRLRSKDLTKEEELILDGGPKDLRVVRGPSAVRRTHQGYGFFFPLLFYSFFLFSTLVRSSRYTDDSDPADAYGCARTRACAHRYSEDWFFFLYIYEKRERDGAVSEIVDPERLDDSFPEKRPRRFQPDSRISLAWRHAHVSSSGEIIISA